jgi:hypothetical protein
VKPASRVASAALICMAMGCRTAPPTGARAVDSALAACIPADSVAIAGIDLDALRRSPLYLKTPAAGVFAAQFTGVSSALLAYNGKELLVIARGRFNSPPAGASMLAPGLALYGSPSQTAAAAAQYKSGRAGAPALLAKAESVAAGVQVWVATRGDAPLPLTGNVAELARILRKAEFLTLTARTGTGLAVELRAWARDAERARAIEETLRADFTLAAAGESRRPDIAAALRGVQVTRMDGEVLVAVAANEQVASQWIAGLMGVLGK